MTCPRQIAVAGFLVAFLLGASRADAMVVDCGPRICFQYDETQAAAAAFGLPFRVGDTLEFLPPAAVALAAGAGNPASLSATFIIDRVFSSLGNLAGLQLHVEGDQDATAGSSVGSSIGLQAFDNSGPGTGNGSASYTAIGDGNGPRLWQLQATLDPDDLSGAPSADLRLQLTSLLSASADGAGASAWIATKYLAISVTAVPAPPAMGLFLAAAAAVGARARRRSRTAG
jgi:hypothetical protein